MNTSRNLWPINISGNMLEVYGGSERYQWNKGEEIYFLYRYDKDLRYFGGRKHNFRLLRCTLTLHMSPSTVFMGMVRSATNIKYLKKRGNSVQKCVQIEQQQLGIRTDWGCRNYHPLLQINCLVFVWLFPGTRILKKALLPLSRAYNSDPPVLPPLRTPP